MFEMSSVEFKKYSNYLNQVLGFANAQFLNTLEGYPFGILDHFANEGDTVSNQNINFKHFKFTSKGISTFKYHNVISFDLDDLKWHGIYDSTKLSINNLVECMINNFNMEKRIRKGILFAKLPQAIDGLGIIQRVSYAIPIRGTIQYIVNEYRYKLTIDIMYAITELEDEPTS